MDLGHGGRVTLIAVVGGRFQQASLDASSSPKSTPQVSTPTPCSAPACACARASSISISPPMRPMSQRRTPSVPDVVLPTPRREPPDLFQSQALPVERPQNPPSALRAQVEGQKMLLRCHKLSVHSL